MASSRQLKARTSEAEGQEAQRRVRGVMSRLRGGMPPEAIWKPFMQSNFVSPSYYETVGLHRVADTDWPPEAPWRAAGAIRLYGLTPPPLI